MFFEIESKKENYMMREGMGNLPADDIEFCLLFHVIENKFNEKITFYFWKTKRLHPVSYEFDGMYYVTMNFRLGEATIFFSRFDSRVVLHIFSPVILIMFMWWWFFEKKNKIALAVFFLRDLIDFSVEMQDWFLILFCFLCFIIPYFRLLAFGHFSCVIFFLPILPCKM